MTFTTPHDHYVLHLLSYILNLAFYYGAKKHNENFTSTVADRETIGVSVTTKVLWSTILQTVCFFIFLAPRPGRSLPSLVKCILVSTSSGHEGFFMLLARITKEKKTDRCKPQWYYA
jgi:hypothetical protein